MMIEAAAESDGLKAIVSEGAGIRSIREARAVEGTRKWLEAVIAHAVVTPGVALFANDRPPPSLQGLIGRIAPRPVFLIYAVPGQGGEAELTEKVSRRRARAHGPSGTSPARGTPAGSRPARPNTSNA